MKAGILKLGFYILLGTASYGITSEVYIVGQKNRTFSKDIMNVSVGDTIHFRNDDNIFHNVYSLSIPQSFDLGTYPQGESKSVTFNYPGKIEVECAIHPEMYMVVNVTE